MLSRGTVTTTFKPERTIQPFYTGGDVVLDRQGRLLATCLGEDALVTDLNTGSLLARIEGDGEVLTALAITPSASHIITCSRSRAMYFHALHASEDNSSALKSSLLRTLKPHESPVTIVVVNSTGTLVATGGADSVVKVWDIRGGYLTHTFRGQNGVISALHFFEAPESEGVNPTRVTGPKPSKYCSDEHGVEYMKNHAMKQENEAQAGGTSSRRKKRRRDNYTDHFGNGEFENMLEPDNDRSHLQGGILQSGELKALADGVGAISEANESLLSKKSNKKNEDNREGQNASDGVINGDGRTASFYLASGSENGKIRIWNLAKRKVTLTLDSHVSAVRALHYSRDQNLLLSASRDKTVIMWGGRDWQARRVLPILEGIEAAGFLGTGTRFYTGGEHGKLRIWETERGREVTKDQAAGIGGDEIVYVLHNSNQNYLLCIHADQNLIFHSTMSLSAVGSDTAGMRIEPLPVLRRISGTHDEIIDLAYVTPQRSLLALATNSENIRLVSLSTTAVNGASSTDASYFGADVAILQGHEDTIVSLDVDWSGCWLASGAKDNTARLWKIDHNTQSFEHYATFTGHAESIGAVSLPSSPPPANSAAHSNPVAYPPAFLLTGSQDTTIKRWEIAKPHASSASSGSTRAAYTRKAHEKEINAISINHQSTLFASASQDRTVKIWSVEEGETQGVLRGHRRGVWSVQFAPKDAQVLAFGGGPVDRSYGLVLTGSGDKTVKIWSLADYSCINSFEGHNSSVLRVLWMPLPASTEANSSASKRPPQIASAGGNGIVKIWDVNSNEEVASLNNHSDRVWALTVDPDTNTLVSGGGDGVVTFWEDTTAATLAAITAAANERVEQDQKLQNCIRSGSYHEAITLALQLNHPARLLALFQSVMDRRPPEEGSLSGLLAVDEVIAHLNDEQIMLLMSRARDWNTNIRTYEVAQMVNHLVFRKHSAERLAAIRVRGRSLEDILASLQAYTERWYTMVSDLIDETYLIDFTLEQMDQLEARERDMDMEMDVDINA